MEFVSLARWEETESADGMLPGKEAIREGSKGATLADVCWLVAMVGQSCINWQSQGKACLDRMWSPSRLNYYLDTLPSSWCGNRGIQSV